MTFRQMVDQHASSLKTQEALVTFIYETVIVSRRDLQKKNVNNRYLKPRSIVSALTLGVNFSLSLFTINGGFFSRECILLACSFNLSFRLNCFPHSLHRNSRLSECLDERCEIGYCHNNLNFEIDTYFKR